MEEEEWLSDADLVRRLATSLKEFLELEEQMEHYQYSIPYHLDKAHCEAVNRVKNTIQRLAKEN